MYVRMAPSSRSSCFFLQEFGDPRGFLRPDVVIARHVKRGERVGDIGDSVVVGAGVAQFEGHRGLAASELFGPGLLDVDVVAHLIEHRIHRLALAKLRIQIEAIDELRQP